MTPTPQLSSWSLYLSSFWDWLPTEKLVLCDNPSMACFTECISTDSATVSFHIICVSGGNIRDQNEKCLSCFKNPIWRWGIFLESNLLGVTKLRTIHANQYYEFTIYNNRISWSGWLINYLSFVTFLYLFWDTACVFFFFFSSYCSCNVTDKNKGFLLMSQTLFSKSVPSHQLQ